MPTTMTKRGRKKKPAGRAKAGRRRSAKSASIEVATRLSPPKAPAGAPPCPQRLARLASAMHAQGLDHFLVTNPVDVGYLTGFLGGDSWLLVGPAGGSKAGVLVSDARYDEELNPTRPLVNVVIREKGMTRAMADLLQASGVSRCGIQGDQLTLADHGALAEALGGGSRVSLVSTLNLVGQMRVVKDAYEIEVIQTATRIQEQALLALLPTIRVGQTELEIAAVLEAEMKKRGSSHCWFQSIVGAQANGSLPHYRPGFTKVAAGKPLLIDWGSTYLGYGGDMTRTFTMHKWSPKMREIYEIVREAQQRAADALAPGRRAHEIDAIARDYIKKHGYVLGHGLGHGLGLSKEPPYLNPLFPDMELEPGHVVTVEPGIYLPGVGGVRLEDLYVVKERGARNFCTLPKDAEWSVLA